METCTTHLPKKSRPLEPLWITMDKQPKKKKDAQSTTQKHLEQNEKKKVHKQGNLQRNQESCCAHNTCDCHLFNGLVARANITISRVQQRFCACVRVSCLSLCVVSCRAVIMFVCYCVCAFLSLVVQVSFVITFVIHSRGALVHISFRFTTVWVVC